MYDRASVAVKVFITSERGKKNESGKEKNNVSQGGEQYENGFLHD